jgi:hypothetical protein
VLRGTPSIFTVIAFGILSTACGSKLSNEQAFALVADSPLFKREYVSQLSFGERCDGVAVAATNAESYVREKHADMVLLAEEGLLKLDEPYIVHPTWHWQNPPALCIRRLKEIARATNDEAAVMRTYYHWTVSVTPKGRELGIPLKGGEVTVATKVLEQITDLTEAEDGAVEARYRWRWAPTKLGEAAPKLLAALAERSKRPFGTARLVKEGDTWIVASVSDTSKEVTQRPEEPIDVPRRKGSF